MEKVETEKIISTACDVHPSLDHILKQYPDNPVFKEVLSNKELVVVDIGCRNPQTLYILYHDFNIKNLYGVDKDPENDSVKEFLRQNKKTNEVKESKTIYDLYRKYLHFSDEELQEGKKYLSKEIFQKTFKLTYGEYGEKFLSNTFEDNSIDILIIEDVLHLLHPLVRTTLLDGVFCKLKTGGLLSIRVNHNDNKEATSIGHFTFSDADLLNLFSEFAKVYTCKKTQEGETKSILFIGRKK
jgi:SAM-dependent methyltransferase